MKAGAIKFSDVEEVKTKQSDDWHPPPTVTLSDCFQLQRQREIGFGKSSSEISLKERWSLRKGF